MKLAVGIDLGTLTRRNFLGTVGKAAFLAAGSTLLPWDKLQAQAKLNVGTMKIGDLSPFFVARDRPLYALGQWRLPSVPAGRSFISMGDAKNHSLLEGRPDDLHADR